VPDMTLDVLLDAIRRHIEVEAETPHEGNELALYGTPGDDALGRVLAEKGGRLVITVNSVPRELAADLDAARHSPPAQDDYAASSVRHRTDTVGETY
jgi:hypothetical protein